MIAGGALLMAMLVASETSCPVGQDKGQLIAKVELEKQRDGKWRVVAWNEPLEPSVPYRFYFTANRDGYVTVWTHPQGGKPPRKIWPDEATGMHYVRAGQRTTLPEKSHFVLEGSGTIEPFTILVTEKVPAADQWGVKDIEVRTSALAGAKDPMRACLAAAPNAVDKPAVIHFELGRK